MRTAEDTLRENMSRLHDLFREQTGLSTSSIERLVARDSRFFSRRDLESFRVRTYDTIVARFSAVWPPEIEWPGDIVRPAPAALTNDEREFLALKLAAATRRRDRQAAKATGILSPTIKETSHGQATV